MKVFYLSAKQHNSIKSPYLHFVQQCSEVQLKAER